MSEEIPRARLEPPSRSTARNRVTRRRFVQGLLAGGVVAGRIEGSYDLLITNRLIAQPQFELNFYSKNDPSRGVGSGLSELDTGLRIRYEFSRKLAPYLGFAYNQTFGTTGSLTRDDGGIVHDPRFIFGLRVWY